MQTIGPKYSTKIPIRINQLSKVAGYKIHTHTHTKTAANLFPNNEQSEKKITKNNALQNRIKKTKHPEINITNEVKDLYNEQLNYKTLLKDI